jgi:hypothetical protein
MHVSIASKATLRLVVIPTPHSIEPHFPGEPAVEIYTSASSGSRGGQAPRDGLTLQTARSLT